MKHVSNSFNTVDLFLSMSFIHEQPKTASSASGSILNNMLTSTRFGRNHASNLTLGTFDGDLDTELEPIPFENFHNFQPSDCWVPETMMLEVGWFLGRDSQQVENICSLVMGRSSSFYPMSYENEVVGCWEFTQFPTAPFSTEFDAGHGDHGMINTMVPHL